MLKHQKKMEVIMIESQAFYRLLELAIAHINGRSTTVTKNNEEKTDLNININNINSFQFLKTRCTRNL